MNEQCIPCVVVKLSVHGNQQIVRSVAGIFTSAKEAQEWVEVRAGRIAAVKYEIHPLESPYSEQLGGVITGGVPG